MDPKKKVMLRSWLKVDGGVLTDIHKKIPLVLCFVGDVIQYCCSQPNAQPFACRSCVGVSRRRHEITASRQTQPIEPRTPQVSHSYPAARSRELLACLLLVS
jgi:hypothetical protein